MNDEHVYLYALALAANPCRATGTGIDPRFPVERICFGQLAAISSRVGLDQFDVSRFRCENSDDAQWLSRVAVVHNEIVAAAWQCPPVMPLPLGALFRSRSSMLAKISQRESDVVRLLLRLGSCQEWAGKLYVSQPPAEHAATRPAAVAPRPANGQGKGAHYLKRKKADYQRRSEAFASLPQEVLAVENALGKQAEECRRVPTLSTNVTRRRERMIWNAAFLVSPDKTDRWLSVAKQVGQASARSKGLRLQITGPWPPYHFCRSLSF